LYITASEKETRGLTVLEALAAGIPVIAPKAGGIIDSIQDSYNGLLYTPQDTNDFIAKIKMSLENESWRENIKEQRLAILNHYNWENRIKELLAIWTDLL
jgi:glycosyltransferase involved in cell wall biosynthesis